METQKLIEKCHAILINTENLQKAGFKDNARKELTELNKVLSAELREKKKK